jgi:hypothetical protein
MFGAVPHGASDVCRRKTIASKPVRFGAQGQKPGTVCSFWL